MRWVLTVIYTCETTTTIKKENIPITPQPATLFPLSIFLARQSLFFFLPPKEGHFCHSDLFALYVSGMICTLLCLASFTQHHDFRCVAGW